MRCTRDVAGGVRSGPSQLGSEGMGGTRSGRRHRGARTPRPEPAATPGARRQPDGGGRRQARFDIEGAGRPGARSRRDGVGCDDSRRRHSDTGADEATDTDLRALAEPAGNDGPPRRWRTKAGPFRHSGGEAVRFAPRDPGGGETTGLAARRGPLQLRRSRDRTPLQLPTSDRDRPHPAVCAGRRCRSGNPQARVPSSSPPSARATGLKVSARAMIPVRYLSGLAHAKPEDTSMTALGWLLPSS